MKTEKEEIITVCLICNKDIEPIDPDIPVVDGCNHAVIWETKGNYGSTVYDSPNGSGYLIAYVCDDCMEERQDRLVTAVKLLPMRRPTHMYKQGIHDDLVGYAPHQETIEVTRAIAALPQCPLCHQKGRHRNACKMKKITEFFDHIDRRGKKHDDKGK